MFDDTWGILRLISQVFYHNIPMNNSSIIHEEPIVSHENHFQLYIYSINNPWKIPHNWQHKYVVISCYIKKKLCQVVSKLGPSWSNFPWGPVVQVARTPCRSRSNLAWLGGFLGREGSPVVTIVFNSQNGSTWSSVTWMVWMRTGVPKNDFGNLHPLVI